MFVSFFCRIIFLPLSHTCSKCAFTEMSALEYVPPFLCSTFNWYGCRVKCLLFSLIRLDFLLCCACQLCKMLHQVLNLHSLVFTERVLVISISQLSIRCHHVSPDMLFMPAYTLLMHSWVVQLLARASKVEPCYNILCDSSCLITMLTYNVNTSLITFVYCLYHILDCNL